MTLRRRTAYAQAHGLGAAGHGTGHWRAQRVSALALVPLALWLGLSLFGGAATDRAALAGFLGQPVNAILMVLSLLAAFHHAALGLQVVAEDYIHTRARFAAIALIRLSCIAGATAGIVATLTMALAG